MARRLLLSLLPLSAWAASSAFGQTEAPTPPPFKPTWETRRHARTYTLTIPAPRGQIADRNGKPLAQTRVSRNLTIEFPTPPDFSDAKALSFAREQIARGEVLTGRRITIGDDAILKHYHNRGVLPLDIATDLSPKEQEAVKNAIAGGRENGGLALREVYLRSYPNGPIAAHLLGYAGRTGRPADGPIQNGDLLWPDAEGREGLEQTFNEQLMGKPGQLTLTFDAKGHKVSEVVTEPPQPGYNVVTTLDLDLQKLCEKALSEGVKRGAIVFIDPNNGDILAMASWPSFDPNDFIPTISEEAFRALNEDKNNPLIPRAFRAAYPPGSTFKAFTALAALESGKIGVDEELSGPPSLQIGNLTFRNWKKTHSGMLNVVDALEESNDTWFYQVGIRTGAKPFVEWARRFGFGMRTGIPLRAEAEGRVPDDDYMRKTHGRRLLDGDLANFSIGQGDLLVTPLQLAQAYATLANGGSWFQTRLVQQVQSLDDTIVTGYEVRLRDQFPLEPQVREAIRKGLVEATSGGRGTGHRASLDRVEVAGKTGTAQWGPKNNERYAAWYAGFVPAESPRYAFAVIYESDPKETRAHGGSVAAPIVGKVLKEVFKEEEKSPKRKKREPKPEPKEEELSD